MKNIRYEQLKIPNTHVGFIKPMKPVLERAPFSLPDWVYERYLNGIRAIAIKYEKRVLLYSEAGESLNKDFVHIVHALELIPEHYFVIDGEIVFLIDGKISPQQTQVKKSAFALYCLFDVMVLGGHDIRRLPLRTRKDLLEQAIEPIGPIHHLAYSQERGDDLYHTACERKWEGIIAKRAASPYISKRSRDWVTITCEKGQDFLFIGYTPPKKSSLHFGAILLGYYQGERLRYAGKVGTGFTQDQRKRLIERLGRIHIAKTPLSQHIHEPHVQWVKPMLIARVSFSKWTPRNILLHPRFVAMREDTHPKEVKKEPYAF